MLRTPVLVITALLAACGSTPADDTGVCADRSSAETCLVCCEAEGYAGRNYVSGSEQACECVTASEAVDSAG